MYYIVQIIYINKMNEIEKNKLEKIIKEGKFYKNLIERYDTDRIAHITCDVCDKNITCGFGCGNIDICVLCIHKYNNNGNIIYE